MDPNRRTLLSLGALAPFATLAGARNALAQPYRFGDTPQDAQALAEKAHAQLMADPELTFAGTEEIAMLCYDRMTLLDLIGPQFFFAGLLGAKVRLVSPDPALKPIVGDTGVAVVPDTTFEDCPQDLDVLFVGGGAAATARVMADDHYIDFVADRGSRAKYVTSVCTGSLILGQAGLLQGKRATSHWATRHLLPEFGATEVNARVVTDGTTITAAGISAGLDFALTLVAALRGQAYAEALQLQAEYAPAPPFAAGTPEQVGPERAAIIHDMFATSLYEMKQASLKKRL